MLISASCFGLCKGLCSRNAFPAQRVHASTHKWERQNELRRLVEIIASTRIGCGARRTSSESRCDLYLRGGVDKLWLQTILIRLWRTVREVVNRGWLGYRVGPSSRNQRRRCSAPRRHRDGRRASFPISSSARTPSPANQVSSRKRHR